MKVETKKLKLFLLDSGLITSKDITEAENKVKKTGEYLGDALVSGGKISEDDLRRLEAYILGIPFVGLEKEKNRFCGLEPYTGTDCQKSQHRGLPEKQRRFGSGDARPGRPGHD